MIADSDFRALLDARWHGPEELTRRLRDRARRTGPLPDRVLIVAADHPARGMLGVGRRALAMADRRGLLERLAVALADPRVDGVLASADILEDLAFLGLLEERLAFGTMNRGGLQGAAWEIDDRFTGYDAEHIEALGLDGGKMLLRIDDDDPGTVPTLEGCALAVTELGDRGLVAMVEPLPYRKDEGGRAVLDPDEDRLVRAVAVASGLGSIAARTWLKVPATADPELVMGASTLPVLLLGGAPPPDPLELLARWENALAHPHVRGLVVGRALLYPDDDDVAAAIDAAAATVARARTEARR
jgi:Cgl0159-like